MYEHELFSAAADCNARMLHDNKYTSQEKWNRNVNECKLK